MILKNHIAFRFLTDSTLPMEMISSTYPADFKQMIDTLDTKEAKISPNVASLFHLLSSEEQKTFYITDTVIKHLDALKIKKINTEGIGEHYDWTYFKGLKNQKTTFIFPDNSLLRFSVDGDTLHFCNLFFNFNKGDKNNGQLNWTMFYVNRMTGEQCEHFNHNDVKEIELFVYRLLSFFYLSENEHIIIEPGGKNGNRKQGKFINSFANIPVTIVNSKWNITSIRTEGFDVDGHFAMRWTGAGRNVPRLVLIEPFKKHGYVRRAKNLDII